MIGVGEIGLVAFAGDGIGDVVVDSPGTTTEITGGGGEKKIGKNVWF